MTKSYFLMTIPAFSSRGINHCIKTRWARFMIFLIPQKTWIITVSWSNSVNRKGASFTIPVNQVWAEITTGTVSIVRLMNLRVILLCKFISKFWQQGINLMQTIYLNKKVVNFLDRKKRTRVTNYTFDIYIFSKFKTFVRS